MFGCYGRAGEKYRYVHESGVDSEGDSGVGVSRIPFSGSKIHFNGKFWIDLTNLGYRIYTKYSHHSHYFIFLFNKSNLVFINVCKIAG